VGEGAVSSCETAGEGFKAAAVKPLKPSSGRAGRHLLPQGEKVDERKCPEPMLSYRWPYSRTTAVPEAETISIDPFSPTVS
jgi:hypothetical protein